MNGVYHSKKGAKHCCSILPRPSKRNAVSLGRLPVVGVGDFIASAAFPDGFALGLQRLEVVFQFEPIVLAGRTQIARHYLLWLYFASGLAGGRGFSDVVRRSKCSLLLCHWPGSHTIRSVVGILIALKQKLFIHINYSWLGNMSGYRLSGEFRHSDDHRSCWRQQLSVGSEGQRGCL